MLADTDWFILLLMMETIPNRGITPLPLAEHLH
jgi:hypothetical protein